MLDNPIDVSVKRYLLRFMLIYLGLIVAGFITLFLLDMAQVNLDKVPNFSLSGAITLLATSIICQQFAKKQLRFFTPRELNRMIMGTTLLTNLVQIGFGALYFGLLYLAITPEKAASDPNLEKLYHFMSLPIWFWPLIIVIMLVTGFIWQNFSFRLFGRRMVKASLAKLKKPVPNTNNP